MMKKGLLLLLFAVPLVAPLVAMDLDACRKMAEGPEGSRTKVVEWSTEEEDCTICVICNDALSNGDQIYILPCCSHYSVHEKCAEDGFVKCNGCAGEYDIAYLKSQQYDSGIELSSEEKQVVMTSARKALANISSLFEGNSRTKVREKIIDFFKALTFPPVKQLTEEELDRHNQAPAVGHWASNALNFLLPEIEIMLGKQGAILQNRSFVITHVIFMSRLIRRLDLARYFGSMQPIVGRYFKSMQSPEVIRKHSVSVDLHSLGETKANEVWDILNKEVARFEEDLYQNDRGKLEKIVIALVEEVRTRISFGMMEFEKSLANFFQDRELYELKMELE